MKFSYALIRMMHTGARERAAATVLLDRSSRRSLMRARPLAFGVLLALPTFCACAQTSHTEYPGVAPAHVVQSLRVCADPNNLPFSNRAEQGFENKLAQLVGAAMHTPVAYTWAPQSKHFLRDTLDAKKCDVVMGLPTADQAALTTAPYYRSSYALVYRANAPYQLRSLTDPRLRHMEIGVHSIGDDWVDLPGGAVLASRGIVRNVHVYKLFANYGRPNPSADLIEAVATGDVDVAIAWGPLAGYFATREPVKLTVVPLAHTHAVLPFQFSISVAVRHGDEALRDRIETILQQKHAAIHALLASYGVPQLDMKTVSPAATDTAIRDTGKLTGIATEQAQ